MDYVRKKVGVIIPVRVYACVLAFARVCMNG